MAAASDATSQLSGRVSRNRRLFHYFWRYKGLFAAGTLALVLTNLLALLIPRRIGEAIQFLRDAGDAAAGLDLSLVQENAVIIILLAVGSALARVCSRILVFNAGRHVEYLLRNDVFAHLARMSQSFFQGESTGDLVSRSINDVTYLRLLYGAGTLNLVNTGVAYVMVLTMMLGVSWELTLLSVAPYPFVLLTIGLFTRALYRRTRLTQAELSNVSARAQENLSGASVVRAFSIQREEAQSFREVSDSGLQWDGRWFEIPRRF